MPRASTLLPTDLIAALESGATLIVPNRRSAHRFKLLYANHCLEAGRRAWPTPAIYPFNVFVTSLWREGGGQTRLLNLRQSELLWEKIVVESEWAASLLSPQSAAATAFRSWQRVLSWRISRDDLAVHAGESEETRALLEWSDRFVAACERREWLSELLLPTRWLSSPRKGRAAAIVTITDDWTPLEQAVFRTLQELGARWDKISEQAIDARAETRRQETPRLELQSAADWARGQLELGARSIAVAVPQLAERASEVMRVFAEVFAQGTRALTGTASPADDRLEREASFAIAAVHRLSEFPLVRGALDLLQLCGAHANGVLVGAVLRSPLLSGSLAEAGPRAIADRKLREDKREIYDLSALERLAVSAQCDSLARSARAAREVRLRNASRLLPSAFAEQAVQVWQAFGWPGDAQLDSDELQIKSRLLGCLAEFGALDELLGPLSYATAVREFESLVRSVEFEPRSFPAPITLLDLNAVEERRFDALWVTGADDARWPPPPSPDPFIPVELQIRAGMPFATAKTARDEAKKRFARLRSAAAEVVFSWPRKDEDVEVQPSPWLNELDSGAPTLEPTPSFIERIFGSRPVLQVLNEASAPSFALPHARGGARIFELQSQCPFRAFAELRCHAERLDPIVPSIDARDRGILVHAALQDLWEDLKGSSGLAATTQEQLTALVRTAVARHAAPLQQGASPHRFRMLQIEQELAIERILLLTDLERARAPFRVAGRLETKERAQVGPLSFDLRLDRVDELIGGESAGSRIVIDYKTGAKLSTRSWLKERPEQPQLPLYAVTHPQSLTAVAFATVSAHSVGFHGVAREDGVLPDVLAFDGKDLPPPHIEWNGLLDYWRILIERLAGEFSSGDARVDPLPSACRNCHLSVLCRIHELPTIVEEDPS